MKSKRTLLIIAIAIPFVILFIVVFINIIKKDIWDVNEKLLKQEVITLEESVVTVNLLDVTPFEWDVVYSFDPYTPKSVVYETVGYKWDRISEIVNEGMNQLVFLKDGEVVCYLYGYPGNNGYGIFLTDKNNTGLSSATMLGVEDDLTFQVERND